ncbi:MAG: GNAT family N-acetyltransferase [Phycisphaerae bacterium]
MDRDKLVLIRPDRKLHREAVFDLTGKTFGHTYWDWMTHCRETYFDCAAYDWSASTIGLLGDRIVTHWGVWRFRMRIGRAAVRVGGIGAVSTHGDLRRRGLMARTAAAGIEAMRRAGYDMSLLFGISDLYHRFGYVRAWADHEYVVTVKDLPAGPPAGRLRRIPPRHRDDLARLYNRTHAGLTGTAVRPTYLRRGKDWQGHVWTDRSGVAAGYIFTRSGRHGFGICDHGGEAEDILRAVARVARRSGEKEVRFCALHYDSELARRLRRGNCRLEQRYSGSGGPMIRTINLASSLRKLAGELSARLKRSHLADWDGQLLIADGRESVTLEIRRSRARLASPGRALAARHAIRAGDAVGQLLIGADEPGDIVASPGIRLTGDARKLLGVLFPNQRPMLGAWDHF